MQETVKKVFSKRVLVHAGFILATVVVLLVVDRYYFGNAGSQTAKQDYLTILYFLVSVYVGRWICKTWFLKKRYIAFSIITLLGFIAILYGGKYLLSRLLPLNQKHLDEYFFAITPLFLLGMLAGIFIPMIRYLVIKQVADAEKLTEQKQAELNLLQSQISPHFLFNTLNNLYGISINQHEKIPGLLLKLSELLRYSVYETSQLFIPLAEEIKYINNYISFEELRIGERLQLRTDIMKEECEQISIAPMLLSVFIENAFKHSKDSLDKRMFIELSLKIEGDQILFSIVNSYDDRKENKQNTGSGLGLVNVKKRLDLLYADEYVLREERVENRYSTTLQLKAK